MKFAIDFYRQPSYLLGERASLHSNLKVDKTCALKLKKEIEKIVSIK
jgi:hypothetical protein